LPEDGKACNRCGYQIDELPIELFSPQNVPYASPDTSDVGEEVTAKSLDFTHELNQTLPTEAGLNSIHEDDYQALPTDRPRQKTQPLHDEHNQDQPLPAAYPKTQPLLSGDQQAVPLPGLHYQIQSTNNVHSQKALHSAQARRVALLFSIVAIVTIASIIVYTNTNKTTATEPDITLVASGNAIPGQTLQVVGHHFTPSQTVLVTMDGQSVATDGTVPYTWQLSVLQNRGGSTLGLSAPSLSTALLAATSAGTPVTVQVDGTFTIKIRIDSDWHVGSIHRLSVEDRQGKELKSINLTIQSNQLTVIATPTPTSPTPAGTTPAQPPSTPVVRTLTSQQTQSQTANATGQGTTSATQATGTIEIVNYSTSPLQLSAGTVLANNAGCAPSGMQISLDSDVNLEAYSGSTETATTYPATNVGIHVVETGAAGNVQDCSTSPAFAYCYTACNTLAWGAVDKGGFSGGTDAQTYAIVQQSDIDNAANSLKASTKQSAVANINSRLHSNEHLVSDPQCSYKVTSNHAAGDKVSTVTVTVQATCTAKASS
jgi:hypothetical protein